MENPVFSSVTITSTTPTVATGDAANFCGIYNPYSTGGEDKTLLYLGADDKLYYPSADMTIGACRAYFTLNGITAGEPTDNSAGVRAFVLNFGEGGETGIISPSRKPERQGTSGWYTLDGRRLNGKPTMHGIYVNNGVKVVIK